MHKLIYPNLSFCVTGDLLSRCLGIIYEYNKMGIIKQCLHDNKQLDFKISRLTRKYQIGYFLM